MRSTLWADASHPDPARQEFPEEHGVLVLFAFWSLLQKTFLAVVVFLFYFFNENVTEITRGSLEF